MLTFNFYVKSFLTFRDTQLKLNVSFFQIHKLYRSTGASLAKAQAEFTSGVMSNETVRQAAAEAARESVRAQFANATSNGGSGQGQGGNRF